MNELEWIYHMLTNARRVKVNITAEGDDLTNDPKHDKLGHHQKTFVFRARYRSTAKLIKVVARNEEEAVMKAAKRTDVKGCMELILQEERD